MAHQGVAWETLTAEEWDGLPWESSYRIADGGDIFTQRHTLELWAEHHHEPVRNVRFARRPMPDPDEGWDEIAERGATGVTHWKPVDRVMARADGSPEHSPHITTAHRVYEGSSGEIVVDPPVDGPHVFINRLRYGNLSEPMSGRALRLLPNPPVPEDDDLWEETAVGADGDRLVGRDDVLKVGNGERFYTSPSSITAGSPEHSTEEAKVCKLCNGRGYRKVAGAPYSEPCGCEHSTEPER
jgi:hypothetical protein